jgi:hypothetical protein
MARLPEWWWREDPALVDVGIQLWVSQLELLIEESKEGVAGVDAPVQPAGWDVF